MHGRCRLILSAALALSGALTLASRSFADDPTCNGSVTVVFKRKTDLPPPVLALIAKVEPMADVGEPFEKTDAVGSNPPLPFQRFISAEQRGCDLTINYERGGRAYGRDVILLRQVGGDWMVRHGSSYPYSRLERSP
jgi:hypothetical protein